MSVGRRSHALLFWLSFMRPRLLRSSCEGPAARLGRGATSAGKTAVVRAMPTTVTDAGPKEPNRTPAHDEGQTAARRNSLWIHSANHHSDRASDHPVAPLR